MSKVGGEHHRDLGKITDTAWPGSCPSKHEQAIISVVCGNTHLGWALHLGINGQFLPQLFWRTPALNNDEIQTGDPCSILERYLPNGGHELIFGSQSAAANKAQAAKTASERRIPTLSVYVVSTNPDNEAGVEFLFRDVPCRLYRLKASDFFTVDQGAYDGMGIDRLANMKAAGKFYKPPLMVIDGGTAMTYTGADAKGNIIGGGIYPGLAALFRGLHDYTGALPLLAQEEVNKMMEQAIATKTPLSLFGKDTKSAMIAPGLKAFAEVCWGAVDSFKKELTENKEQDDEPKPAADEPTAMEVDNEDNNETADKDDKVKGLLTICLTGGDGDVIARLLEPDHSSIVASMMPEDASDGIEIQKHKHLTHYGIGQVLDEKTNAGQALQSEDDRVREDIVGQRVAKKFRIRTEDKVFRGSIAAVAAGKTLDDDWFYVRYDDGDTEHLTLTGLYDGLVLYKEAGELDKEATSAKNKLKAQQAEETAKLIVTKSVEVKKHSETPAAERKATARKRGAGPTKSAPPAKVAKGRTPGRKINPFSYVNQRIAKYFGDEVFFGRVKRYIEPTSGEDDLWHIVYDDDDQEDYDGKDLRKAVALYKTKRSEDKVSKVKEIEGLDAENQAKPKPTRDTAEEEEEENDAPAAEDETAAEAPAADADAPPAEDAAAPTDDAAADATAPTDEAPAAEGAAEETPEETPAETPAAAAESGTESAPAETSVAETAPAPAPVAAVEPAPAPAGDSAAPAGESP